MLAFGFDEETKGTEGALQLSKRLQSVYGPGGIALILDEGAGFTEIYGQIFASPGVAEKGMDKIRLSAVSLLDQDTWMRQSQSRCLEDTRRFRLIIRYVCSTNIDKDC